MIFLRDVQRYTVIYIVGPRNGFGNGIECEVFYPKEAEVRKTFTTVRLE